MGVYKTVHTSYKKLKRYRPLQAVSSDKFAYITMAGMLVAIIYAMISVAYGRVAPNNAKMPPAVEDVADVEMFARSCLKRIATTIDMKTFTDELITCLMIAIKNYHDVNWDDMIKKDKNGLMVKCKIACFVFQDTGTSAKSKYICNICIGHQPMVAAERCLKRDGVPVKSKVFKHISSFIDCISQTGLNENKKTISSSVTVPYEYVSNDTEHKTYFPSHNVTDYKHMYPASHNVTCISYLILQRVSQKPHEGVCDVDDTGNRSLTDMIRSCGLSGHGNKLQISIHRNSGSCQNTHELWREMRITWICAKLNYGLMGINMITLMVVWLIMKRRKPKYMHWFVLSNMLWVVWRMQETVHVDTRWRDEISYLCIFTGYLGYTSQSVSLYLMAGTSIERMQMIMCPFKSQRSHKTRSVDNTVATLAFGFLVGIVCSVLNAAAVVLMKDPLVARMCQLSSIHADDSLEFLLFVKIFSVMFIYVVPCAMLAYCNMAALVARKKQMSESGIRASLQNYMKRQKRATMRLSFILFCSALIIISLPNPIFDLQNAFELYFSGELGKRSQVKEIAEGVLTNLTVLAFLLNTVVGMKFSI